MEDDVRRVSKAIGDLMRIAGSDRVHAMRQRATGADLTRTEMRFLAVTDFRLSQRAFVGDATDYRMNADIDAKQRS